MSAPERIWAWVWELPYPSKSNGKAEWNAVMYPSDQSCTEYIRADIAAGYLERGAEIERLRAAFARIADDFVPDHPRDAMQALDEMREAIRAALGEAA